MMQYVYCMLLLWGTGTSIQSFLSTLQSTGTGTHPSMMMNTAVRATVVQ